MFLILLRYKKPVTEVDRFVSEHREFLLYCYASGNFLFSGPKEPRDGGVIFAKGQSKSEIERIIHLDPFHREQIADYEIIEFLPTMVAPGLERLRM